MKFPNFPDLFRPVRGLLVLAGFLLFVTAVPAQQNFGFVTVIKVVETPDLSGQSTIAFPFTATPNFGPASFSLIDNVPGPGGQPLQSIPITNFGIGNEVIINEENFFNWSLAGIVCSVNGNAQILSNTVPPQPAPHAGTVIIRLQPGGTATCIFTNTQVGPTAAPASVSGRIIGASGTPLTGVSVVLTDVSTGVTRSGRSNTFGYFVFDDCDTEDFYILRVVSSKRYTFSSDTRSFTLLDNAAGMDFVADP